jgi:hypothetical protein
VFFSLAYNKQAKGFKTLIVNVDDVPYKILGEGFVKVLLIITARIKDNVSRIDNK